MKKLIFLLAFICLCGKGFAQAGLKLKDGLYLVSEVVSDSTRQKPGKGSTFVIFNPLFLENAPDSAQGLLVSTTEFVPLELQEAPELTGQADQKKTVQLSFTRLAADTLAAFSSRHIMQQVTLILDGQALTMHKVRSAITSGKLQISRCDDTACEKIYVQLKAHIK